MAIDFCAYCAYMDAEDENHGKFRCEKDDKYYSADSIACSNNCARFREDMHIGDDILKKSRDYRAEKENEYKSVGCFITTIVVNILGFDDNCEVLTVLRKFRNNRLQVNPQYRDILIKYDVVGPMIAQKINEDVLKEEIALDLYFDYLIPCVDSLKLGNEEEAVAKYIEMTNILTNRYLADRNLVVSNEIKENYDQREGGHGRLCLN